MYVYIHVYVPLFTCMYIYTHWVFLKKQREREKERDGEICVCLKTQKEREKARKREHLLTQVRAHTHTHTHTHRICSSRILASHTCYTLNTRECRWRGSSAAGRRQCAHANARTHTRSHTSHPPTHRICSSRILESHTCYTLNTRECRGRGRAAAVRRQGTHANARTHTHALTHIGFARVEFWSTALATRSLQESVDGAEGRRQCVSFEAGDSTSLDLTGAVERKGRKESKE